MPGEVIEFDFDAERLYITAAIPAQIAVALVAAAILRCCISSAVSLQPLQPGPRTVPMHCRPKGRRFIARHAGNMHQWWALFLLPRRSRPRSPASGCQACRRAFLMEIDALYCDVIVQRWEQFTGRKAERIGKEADAA